MEINFGKDILQDTVPGHTLQRRPQGPAAAKRATVTLETLKHRIILWVSLLLGTDYDLPSPLAHPATARCERLLWAWENFRDTPRCGHLDE